MNRKKEDIYLVSSYTDEELIQLLDLQEPSDRELEAKIIFFIKKYANIQNESAEQLSRFFTDIYGRFFDINDDDEDTVEGIENTQEEGYQNMATEQSGSITTNQDSNIEESPPPQITPSQITPSPPPKTQEPIKQNTEMDKNAITLTKSLDYTKDKINPILQQTIKRVVSIDSQYRDNKTSMTTEFTFNLSEPLRDVVALKLYSVQIPYTWYTINTYYGSNFFVFKANSAGIIDYDFKVEIEPGNYTPTELVSAVNDSITVLKSIHTDVSFGNTNLSYNNNTSLSKITIDITNQFNETSYKLGFPIWTSPLLKDSEGLDVSNITTIPQMLGFNYINYNSYSIKSYDMYSSVIANNTSKIYNLTEKNNYITIYKYLGPESISNASKIDTSFNITFSLPLSKNSQSYTRHQLYQDLNTQILNCGYLDGSSNLAGIAIRSVYDELENPYMLDVSNLYSNSLSFFELFFKPNRNTTHNIGYSKICVEYNEDPDETNNIWVGASSCFQLKNYNSDDSHFLETNTIYSENPPAAMSVDNITLYMTPSIRLECNKEGFDISKNSYQFDIPKNTTIANKSTDPGYSLFSTNPATNYMSVINGVINNNIYSGEINTNITKALITADDKFQINFDIFKKIDETNLFLDLSSIFFNNRINSVQDSDGNTISNIEAINLGLAANETIKIRIKNNQNIITFNDTHIFTLKGRDGTSRVAGDYTCEFKTLPQKTIITPNDLMGFLNNQFRIFVDKVDGDTVLSESIINITATSTELICDLTIKYAKYLTEKDYNIQFLDIPQSEFLIKYNEEHTLLYDCNFGPDLTIDNIKYIDLTNKKSVGSRFIDKSHLFFFKYGNAPQDQNMMKFEEKFYPTEYQLGPYTITIPLPIRPPTSGEYDLSWNAYNVDEYFTTINNYMTNFGDNTHPLYGSTWLKIDDTNTLIRRTTFDLSLSIYKKYSTTDFIMNIGGCVLDSLISPQSSPRNINLASNGGEITDIVIDVNMNYYSIVSDSNNPSNPRILFYLASVDNSYNIKVPFKKGSAQSNNYNYGILLQDINNSLDSIPELAGSNIAIQIVNATTTITTLTIIMNKQFETPNFKVSNSSGLYYEPLFLRNSTTTGDITIGSPPVKIGLGLVNPDAPSFFRGAPYQTPYYGTLIEFCVNPTSKIVNTDDMAFSYIVPDPEDIELYSVIELRDKINKYITDYSYKSLNNDDLSGTRVVMKRVPNTNLIDCSLEIQIDNSSWSRFLKVDQRMIDNSFSLASPNSQDYLDTANIRIGNSLSTIGGVMIDTTLGIVGSDYCNLSLFKLNAENNHFYITADDNGLKNKQYKIQIPFTTNDNTYSRLRLVNKINEIFKETPELAASEISIFIDTKTNKEVTKVRLTINKVYTSNDYIVDFYDPFNYVKCYLGSKTIRNTSWDSTLGWILGYRLNTNYDYGDIDVQGQITQNGNEIYVISDTTLSTNLYNYFMISLDDFNQNRFNDGLVTITEKDTTIPLPSYASRLQNRCPTSNPLLIEDTNAVGLTQNQIYSMAQITNSNLAFNLKQKKYSSTPSVEDIFGIIPLKLNGLQNGQYFVEYGGTLQNQERTYFGPVNIYRIKVKLVTDRGELVNLNGSNWSFSLICEQLYKQSADNI